MQMDDDDNTVLSIFITKENTVISSLNIQIVTMTWCGVFSGALYIKSLQCVQLERTTLGCMEHRKQMPFLSAATTYRHRTNLRPMGFCWYKRGALLSLVINSFEYCTKTISIGAEKTFPDLIAKNIPTEKAPVVVVIKISHIYI